MDSSVLRRAHYVPDYRGWTRQISEEIRNDSPCIGTHTVRSVFIVDPGGIIRLMLTYPATVGRNIYEILRAVQALQAVDANQAATPANWPNNEIIGNQLILPAARTVQEAAERTKLSQAGQLKCYDWWFCMKQG